MFEILTYIKIHLKSGELIRCKGKFVRREIELLLDKCLLKQRFVKMSKPSLFCINPNEILYVVAIDEEEYELHNKLREDV